MVKKTITQLKRELENLKRKDKIKTSKLNKALRDDQEAKELEKEIKELKRSPFYRKLRTLSKKNLSKKELDRRREQFQKGGKAAGSSAKAIWGALGKVVNKLDKISV